jgi:serine/threonine protein kinase/HEAT repeat protein
MSGHSAPPMAPRDPLIGVELDNYRVESKIAEGGMGLIYRAVHSVIGRQAAIKVLSHRYSDDANMIKRLHREAVAVNRIGHPSIVDIFGFGRTPDNREYFIMEFLDGESLAEVIDRQGALPWAFTSQVFAQSLGALAAAHDLDIIHRDIKPENILILRDGDKVTAKVLDFGIAKSIGVGEGSEQLTSAGSVMGTPEYIAPEQIRGKTVDGRADLYAMGVILYEMVAGKRPYDSDKVMSLLMSHLRDPIPPVPTPASQLEVPASVLEVIPKAMAKEPPQRFQDARSFAKALGLETHAVTSGDGTRPLPDMFWESDASQSTGELSGHHGTAPRAALSGGTGAVARQAQTEQQLPIQDIRKRSPLVWIAPLALILLSGAAIAFIALRGKGADGDGSGSATGSAVASGKGTGSGKGRNGATAKAIVFKPIKSLKDLLFRVRTTLNKGLNNSDTAIRRRAVVGVGDLHDKNVRQQLIEVLKTDTELGVRATAAKALSQLGDPTVATVLKAARRIQEPSVRVAIDDALRRLHDPAGKRGLTKALASKDRGVSAAAALALGETGDASAKVRKVLEGLLATGNAKLAPPVLSALAKTGHGKALETLRKGAQKGDARTKLSYAEALAKLGDEGAGAALKNIATAKSSAELPTRLVAAKGLAILGDYTGLPVLKQGVAHTSAQVRQVAADALGAMSDRAALPPLAHALEDKEQLVRVTAAASLARILALMPDKLLISGQNWLLAALSQGDWSARYAAVGLTAEMDPELAVELLGWALEDKDERVRAAAVRRLAKLARKSAKARKYVRARLFNDSSPAVRAAAAEGLGASGDGKDKALLLAAATGDKSRSVVGIAAAGQLLAMGDTRGLAGLLKATKAKSAGTRARAYRALARWRNASKRRKVLRRGLGDKSGDVRLASALALARLGVKAKKAVKVLERAVTKEGSQPALAALSKLGVSQAKQVKLLARAKSNRLRRTAMTSAVAALGAKGALPLLRRGARDDAVGVRRAAAQGLASIAAKRPAAVAPLLNKLARDPDATVRAAAAVGLAKLPRKGNTKAAEAKVVKMGPAPAEPKLPEKPKTKPGKPGKPVKLELSFVEDNRREASYKELIVRAELQLRRGRYLAALRTLSKARRVGKNRAPALFETGRVLMKLAVQAKSGGKKRTARKHAKNARRYYKAYLRKAPRGKQATNARGGVRDAARLLKSLR